MPDTQLQQHLLTAIENGHLQGQLKLNELLSRYTTWRIGGAAECFYQPANETDLQQLLKMLPANTAINWIGLGSNLLIRDGGIKGVVIYTNGVLNELDINCSAQGKNSQCLISAQAGVPCAIFARKAANESINGAEFLSGIPGTIGGALAMNAGAFGGETWRYVQSVQMIDRQGEISSHTADDFAIQYRQVRMKDGSAIKQWFLSAVFSFTRDAQGLMQSKQEIKRLLKHRAETQPTQQANAGSVFKNPANDYAARLIERCGLKGEAVNDAQISAKHANFIINKGAARAEDVEALINKIKNAVYAQYQINLETEVRIIGDY